MKKNPFENLKDVVKLEEVCPVHNVHLQQLDKVLVIAGSQTKKARPFLSRMCQRGNSSKEPKRTWKAQK